MKIKNLIINLAAVLFTGLLFGVANADVLPDGRVTCTGSLCGGFGLGAVMGGLWAVMAGMFVVVILVCIGLYIYSALAYMAIAKKLNEPQGWLAWIPVVNIYLLTKLALQPWWQVLVIIALFVPILNVLAAAAFIGLVIFWHWKIFERLGRDGWWSLMMIIPIVGHVIFWVLLGVAAWGKPRSEQMQLPNA